MIAGAVSWMILAVLGQVERRMDVNKRGKSNMA